MKYFRSVPLQDRVDEVLSWFDVPMKDIPALSMIYFEQPDQAGHLGGPFGDPV